MTNQRMKWDAKAAFKRIDEQIANDEPSERAAADRNEMAGFSYAPPSNIGPERLAQLRKYEPPAKPHGRDIESLMRYHEAHRKGRTDDDCLREKFGRSAKIETHPCGCHQRDDGTWVHLDESCKVHGLAPTPTQSAIGGKPLLSAGHGKDVDTADGPWPKCALSPSSKGIGLSVVFIQAEAGGAITAYYTDGTTAMYRTSNGVLAFGAICTDVGAIIRALEQNGHADAAAQLLGKARDDVATGGGRVWRNAYGVVRTEVGGNHFLKAPAWGVAPYAPDARHLEVNEYTELFGTERDAILSECRKAMGLDTSTVRVTISTAPRAEMDCKTRRELKQTYVKIEMATGLIIPCDETDPNRIGYVR